MSKESVIESFIDDDVQTSQFYALDSDSEGYANIYDTKTAILTLQEMYEVCLTMRNNLCNHSSSWYENWPPFASNINVDNVKEIGITSFVQVYGLAAWIFR